MPADPATPADVFDEVFDIEEAIGEISTLTAILLELSEHRGGGDAPVAYLAGQLEDQVTALKTGYRTTFDAAARCRSSFGFDQ